MTPEQEKDLQKRLTQIEELTDIDELQKIVSGTEAYQFWSSQRGPAPPEHVVYITARRTLQLRKVEKAEREHVVAALMRDFDVAWDVAQRLRRFDSLNDSGPVTWVAAVLVLIVAAGIERRHYYYHPEKP